MTWEELKAQYRKENPLLAEAVDIAVKMVTDMDMVEVVRCKECKWSYWQDETEWTYEGLYCRQYEASMHDDDFCSRGEKVTE